MDTQFPPTSLQFPWFLLSVLLCEGDFGVPAVVSMTPKTWAFPLTGRELRGWGPAPLKCTVLVLSTGRHLWDLWASSLFLSQFDPKAILSLASPLLDDTRMTLDLHRMQEKKKQILIWF